MELGEAYAAVEDEHVARVLEVVLVVGVVDDALQVALVVAHDVGVFKDVFHIGEKKCRRSMYDGTGWYVLMY